ncbi:NADPH:quinone reductase-like Zn-dependent oxidoreductase [Variovorax boronicumulans]|uniref:zinc-dependent alcohol dehydrogenase family protein n=1 Tax=Variovorax boronicumulans TaxID=436515 RepID=UPI0027818D15|nr:NAD(P)-dependent alcohol dehydrogenase [Variovorax boronicumulans]MDQ0085107.1 NADPH:quinone reductase-like Zn-dependent oxidoreductase [Variovorax boronicumulans]
MYEPRTLRRWQLPTLGRAHLEQAEAPLPVPGANQILVKVGAVSLNYRDLLMIRDGMGMALDLPFTPGSDMAGTVTAIGPGVTRFAVGDRVVNTFWGGWIDSHWHAEATLLGGPGPGMLASHVLLDATWAVAAPTTLSLAEASTLPCAGLTAWFALAETGALRAGETVLIHGTGGVALFGLQIARLHGAQAIVVTGSEDKRAQALALGATHVLARDGDWPAEVHRLTQGRGADHVLELASGPNLDRSLQAVRQGGRVSIIGMLGGETLSASFYAMVLGRVTVQGIGVGHRRALEDLVRAVDANALKPVIAARYGFDALPAALDHLERGAFGKIVVTL